MLLQLEFLGPQEPQAKPNVDPASASISSVSGTALLNELIWGHTAAHDESSVMKPSHEPVGTNPLLAAPAFSSNSGESNSYLHELSWDHLFLLPSDAGFHKLNTPQMVLEGTATQSELPFPKDDAHFTANSYQASTSNTSSTQDKQLGPTVADLDPSSTSPSRFSDQSLRSPSAEVQMKNGSGLHLCLSCGKEFSESAKLR